MKVLYINCDGGGFANFVDVEPGTTVGQFFEQRVDGPPEAYLIRVNRLPTNRDQVLQEQDRITITPTRIEGADLQNLCEFDCGESPCNRPSHVGYYDLR